MIFEELGQPNKKSIITQPAGEFWSVVWRRSHQTTLPTLQQQDYLSSNKKAVKGLSTAHHWINLSSGAPDAALTPGDLLRGDKSFGIHL